MKKIKPILLVKFNSTTLSGGYRRNFEILKKGKSESIDYIIVASPQSYKNAMKIFPAYIKTLSNYTAYVKDFKERESSIPGLNQVFSYGNIFRSALSVSKIAVNENADLIVGGEDPQSLLTSYLAGKFCSKPWTAVFQPSTDLLQPSSSIGSLNAFNILKFVSEKSSQKNLSLISRIGTAAQLFLLLKVAQKSLLLSVSSSVIDELHFLNPRIKFHVIEPGNGIDSEKFDAKSDGNQKYDAIFFARLIPEKGLCDLPVIWKYVTRRIPKAVLAVAGIPENKKHVDHFWDIVNRFRLRQNIIFLGNLEENVLISSIKSAKLTLYPSLLDAFPLVPLESLACGTPVVAYNIAAISHNFEKCDAVMRCPIKDKQLMAKEALSLIENEKRRKTLSKKAKEYCTIYDWRNVIRAEKNSYFKVIECTRR
jgi:glycosyltransferase involved in cell wall biosynthesis